MEVSGDHIVHLFLLHMRELQERLMKELTRNERLKMTADDRRWFNAATVCHICHRPLGEDKVRDHDHYSGKFRGAAHNRCNLQLRKTYKIPVFFHNFRGYDGHIVSLAFDAFQQEKINIIGQGLEKYLTVSWGEHIVFKDSLQFLPSSLETLVSNLARGARGGFLNLIAGFWNCTDDQIGLLLRKDLYP